MVGWDWSGQWAPKKAAEAPIKLVETMLAGLRDQITTEAILHSKHLHPNSNAWEEWAKSKLEQNPWILTRHDLAQANNRKSGVEPRVRRREVLVSSLTPGHG